MEVTLSLGGHTHRRRTWRSSCPHVRTEQHPLHFVTILLSCLNNISLNPQTDSSLGISILKDAQHSPPLSTATSSPRPGAKDLNTPTPTPITRRKSAEVIVYTYIEEYGTLFSIGCDAATVPRVRTLGLSRRSRLFLLAVWRATEVWAVKLQLQGPKHGQGTYGLLQPQASTRVVSNSESCCRLVPKLPHRPKVLQPLHHHC